VTIGQLVFFSTETGDAWMLDLSNRLAARIAAMVDPEPIDIQETETNFIIGWKGHYRIDGHAFAYTDRESDPPRYDPRLASPWLSRILVQPRFLMTLLC
jgi:hypothetical protein